MELLEVSERSITVELDAERRTCEASWLRDHCRCEACWSPSGQRIFEVWREPEPVIEHAEVDGGDLVVRFGPTPHLSTFNPAELAARPQERPPARSLRQLTWHAWSAVALDDGALLSFLADVEAAGLGLVSEVPVVDGQVAVVAERFSPVLETNYGRTFDVQALPDPKNLASSDLGLALHTDNPYREPVPTLQLLHCLRASGEGGSSRFVDAMAVATQLQEDDPEAFELLSTTEVSFVFDDGFHRLEARAPLIELDARGEVRAIRHNARALRLQADDPASSNRWYSAYCTFARRLEADPGLLEVTLAPGDLVCFDNRRVLHGRTAFQNRTGEDRLLQGCYAAMDAVRSVLAAQR